MRMSGALPIKGIVLGKKHKRLFESIVSESNLYDAYHKASKGKRLTMGFLGFKEFEGENIRSIKEELEGGTYTQGEHRVFEIYEPKKRTISALPFRDRIVQHALCSVIGPIFERSMHPSSYACRKGKGTHLGAKKCQSYIRRTVKESGDAYILKTDFSGYFYNIDREVLWRLIRKKISCKKTLWLISRFLPYRGRGIPIGNLTSQLFANIFGCAVDRFLSQTLRVKRFVRYMDDIAIVHSSRRYLEAVEGYLKAFCENRMIMFFSKSYIKNYSQGINFLGYRIFKNYKLIRKDSVTRARRKIKKYTANGDSLSLMRFMGSFRGHVKHADSINLMKNLANYQRGILCLQNTN